MNQKTDLKIENNKEVEKLDKTQEFSLENWFNENREWLFDNRVEIAMGLIFVIIVVAVVFRTVGNVPDDLPPLSNYDPPGSLDLIIESASNGTLPVSSPIFIERERPLLYQRYEISDFEGVFPDDIDWDLDEKFFTFHIFSYSIVDMDHDFISNLLLNPELQKDVLTLWDRKVIKKMFDKGVFDFDKVQYFFQSDLCDDYFKVIFLRGYSSFVVSRNFAEILGLRITQTPPEEEVSLEFLENEEETVTIEEFSELESFDELSESEISLPDAIFKVKKTSENIDVFQLYEEEFSNHSTETETPVRFPYNLRIPEENPFLEYYTPTTNWQRIPWESFTVEDLVAASFRIQKLDEPTRSSDQKLLDDHLARNPDIKEKFIELQTHIQNTIEDEMLFTKQARNSDSESDSDIEFEPDDF